MVERVFQHLAGGHGCGEGVAGEQHMIHTRGQEAAVMPDSSGAVIRQAEVGDLPAITRIHNEGIEDRIATLDLEPYTVEEKAEQFALMTSQDPTLVAEAGGEVVGWASLHPFSSRKGYWGVKELSIYVARPWRYQGIGARLLEELLQRANALNIYKVILNVLPYNQPALALYRQVGFREVGVYHNQGRIDGKWTDILVMEKHLELEDTPAG
ncbi:MAG: N-acetyltransferase family protein [Dehalococcoidia bacterium]|nr:N-acetyltransferase family protein [Dehalococcoidia bacterium]